MSLTHLDFCSHLVISIDELWPVRAVHGSNDVNKFIMKIHYEKTRSCRRIRCIHGWHNLFRIRHARRIQLGKYVAIGCNRGNSWLGLLLRHLSKFAAGPRMQVRLSRPIRQIVRE